MYNIFFEIFDLIYFDRYDIFVILFCEISVGKKPSTKSHNLASNQ